MSRFVISNPDGLLHTDNYVPETIYVSVPGNPTQAVPVSKLLPIFDTKNVLLALKYATAADAHAMLSHPDLQPPEAFAGCEVLECEFDSAHPQALRPAA